MVRDYLRSLSKIAISAALVGIMGLMLVQIPLALAETSEPQDPIPPPIEPVEQYAATCNELAAYAMSCMPTPYSGSGDCIQAMQDARECYAKLSTIYNSYADQARSYWYNRSKQIQQGWEFKLKLAVIGGVVDTLGLVAQRMAYETAQLILTGGDSQEPMFWNQPFGKWVVNVADQASGEFLWNIDKYVRQQAVGTPFEGVSLCRKPNALLIKMNLGMGRMKLLDPRGSQCTLSQIADNFEAVADMVQSGDAIQMQRPQFYEGGPANDLSTGLQINSVYLNYTQQAQVGKTLERQESGGMTPVMDKITGALQYPSILANNSMMQLDPVAMSLAQSDKQESYMVQAFWEAGLESVGFIALKVFLNTMALGILHKIFDQKQIPGANLNASPEQMEIQFQALKNADASGEAQNLFERQDFARALGDFVIPNYNTLVDKDLVSELSSCSEPRTRWNCAMDQALATAIGLSAEKGGLTIGKASGVGSEGSINGPQLTGLHPDWELIPENDIKDNSDPTCYQRAYCAGNLKKMRLARIISVGWEMAANSPYNIKKDGKYVTLGTVIRGFYDCNDKGHLDKEHPWCHLIDPNWILMSPRYQCRAQGYGDAVVKELGTRTQECGDIASCLSTNSKGECTGGYGYCLAERPVYRFDARECESQYASCRTWSRSDGQQLSALRNTVERGNCSEDNIGCMWYATQRYVTSTASPDGLWVGSLTAGPRVYWDKGIQTCATEGCTKTYRVTPGETALNLVQNGSFEQLTQADDNGTTKNVAFNGWEYESCNVKIDFDGFVGVDATDQIQSLSVGQKVCNPNVGDAFTQKIKVGGGRNYVLTLSAKSQSQIEAPVSIAFYMTQPGQADIKLTKPVTSYESCAKGWDATSKTLKFTAQLPVSYAPMICQFVTPPEADYIVLRLQGTSSGTTNYDGVQLEEGEYSTPFVDGIAEGLKTAFIKIPPQEYGCTGDDAQDNPACKKFARICRQIDVGCQGYSDVEDQSAPEIPATLSSKDLCPAICAGYGRYEKLASSFDLVRNVDARLDDPEDQNTEYFIPSLAEKCTLADVGCEAFTSMEAATGTGEQVSYYNELRYCQKPNDKSATYYTWEGSDVTGYQLITWALIKDTDGSPLIKPTGGRLGVIKDSALCDEGSWKDGADPDCRQFYDEKGVAYYRFYSQTVTSDVACTKYRKDDSTQADCIKTGGSEYVPQTKSCMYDALPSLSASCKAAAGGCRAYLGPTGRNASNVFNETFVASSSLGWFMSNVGTMKFSLSKEAVLVGDTSIKMEPVPANGPINSYMALSLPTTSTLYRISFWAKAASNFNATLSVDGETVGQFPVTPVWRRYEFGPFYAKGTAGQGSTKLQKHCGNFTYSPNATLIAKVTANNSGADADTIQATALATLGALMNNPDIAKNVASLANVCTDDTQCSNLSVYAPNNSDVYGTTVKGQCGFAGLAAGVQFSAPSDSKALFVDTLRVDQLNDTQFVRKGLWSVPVACDSTYPEGMPQARAMVGCREYRDRDDNQVFVRSFGSLCNADAIGCKGFIDTDDRPTPYSQTLNVKGTAGPSQRADGTARAYEEQYFGDWGLTSNAYRYIYVIDDSRAQCDSGEASCRAFGKPIFTQDRMDLATTTSMVDPANADVYANQQTVYKFDTVLMKDDWTAYLDENGQPKLACRKDELFCDRYQSGNVTEYFRDPGTHACVWQKVKKMDKNEAGGIMADGEYGGWFREGTEIPCYPGYQKNGDTFGAYFTGEDPYAGWVGKCPADQSECTEFVDPNDHSDAAQANGRSYFLINSSKIDTRTCGGAADPLSGCILFNNKNLSGVQASAKATYAKSLVEKGAPQSPLDCDTDVDNPNCKGDGHCMDFQKVYKPKGANESDGEYQSLVVSQFESMYKKQFVASEIDGSSCDSDAACKLSIMDGPYVTYGDMVGKCVKDQLENDSNVIIKVKLDRECSRWMGCETGETVYDSTQQKYVTQCSQMALCQKNSSKNDDVYCSEFVDRESEDFLKPEQFASLKTYSSRRVGFGAMDYAGLMTPNAYLLPDVEVARVGSDLFGDDPAYSQYKMDQRLVAKLKIGGFVEALPDDPGFPGIKLCQDVRTKRIGYIQKGTQYCILPVSETASLSYVVGDQSGGDVTRDVKNIYKEFANYNVNTDNSLLQSAMPAPECQLYPEADSPLSNEYVAGWDTKVQPPRATAMLEGYENFKACAYGEDCSCSYRKARYEASENKYYSVNGAAPAVGVCLGGQDAGVSCVPGGYVPVDSENKVLVQGSLALSLNAGCRGGVCMALKDVVVENGRYGYCLERDRTRISDVSQSLAPCLSWSPLNVVGGVYDMTHYSPTAGYLPPQGSGEYFCVSGANSQKVETLNTVTTWCDDMGCGGDEILNPGKLSQFGFSRPWIWWSAKNGNYESNPNVISIDGTDNQPDSFAEGKLDRIRTVDANGDPIKDPNGVAYTPSDIVKGANTKNLRFACRRTSLCEGYDMNKDYANNEGDENYWSRMDGNKVEGRWIMTGDSVVNSYMEYFIPHAFGISDTSRYRDRYYDYNYGMFHFSIAPFAAGVACKWNPHWLGLDYPSIDLAVSEKNAVSNFGCQEYLSRVQQTSQQFYQQFSQAFPGILDRNSENLYSDSKDAPIKLKCSLPGGQGACYYKYWETGFQNQEQEAFKWPETVDADKTYLFDFKDEYRRYFAHECKAGKPFFAIRAMFQNVNDLDNALSPDEAKERGLNGPWQFIGFWITTCLPTKTMSDPGWLYMRMDTVRADVCRQVAQVIAPYTRESAAFADRVWSQGKFFIPGLGVNYDSRNQPFGSALAIDKIGNDPMLLGASVPLSGSATERAAFVDSGVGTAAPFSQQDAWVPLTNLFAKVYKVYRWEPSVVKSGDWTCVKGTLVGKPCSGSDPVQALKECGDWAECDTRIDTDLKNRNWRCNTLSGVNRGLHCGDQTYPARNTDVICHNAPVAWRWNDEKNEEQTTPLYSKCLANADNKVEFHLATGIFGQSSAGYFDDYSSFSSEEWIGGPGANANEKDKNFWITFRLAECDNAKGWFYAVPTALSAPKVKGTAGIGYDYSSPIVVVTTLLRQAISDKAKVCSEGATGNMMDDLRYIVDQYGLNNKAPLQAYISTADKTGLIDYSVTGVNTKSGGYVWHYPDEWGQWGYLFSQDHIAGRLKYILSIWETNDKDGQLPKHYNLGKWSQDVNAMLGLYSCGPGSVRTGQKCSGISEHSGDCPMEIEACVNSLDKGMAYGDVNVPTCGFCVKDPKDPYNLNYPHNDGTGYCRGFNPLSRCRTNDDCTFTNYEHWGAFDKGGAEGVDWNRGSTQAMFVFNEEQKQTGDVSPQSASKIMVRLPMPLTNMGSPDGTNYLPQQYSIPATITTFTNSDQCVVRPLKDLCDMMFPYYGGAMGNHFYETYPNVKSFSPPLGTNVSRDYCMRWCRYAGMVMPNSYAQYLNDLAMRGDTNNGVGKKERLAAVAPFSINPLIRTLRSLGTYYNASQLAPPYTPGWIQSVFGIFHVCTINQTCGSVLSFPSPVFDGVLMAADHFYNTGKIDKNHTSIFDTWSQINTRLRNNDSWDPAKTGNDSLPWDASRLRFTTIFPLVVGNKYGAPQLLNNKMMAGPDGWVHYADTWLQVQKMWFGYGMSSKLFKSFDDMVGVQKKNNNAVGDTKEEVAFRKQYLVDMQEEFFDKTGWGSFRNPEDPDLALYPGAMPAAVPDQNNPLPESEKKMFTVFVPGHCEPPQGGTDLDSVDGKTENIMTFDRETAYRGGPPRGFGLGSLLNFVTPWESKEKIYQHYIAQDGDKYFDNYGYTDAEDAVNEHVWTPSYVTAKKGTDSQGIELEGPVGADVNGKRLTCRCIGGKRDGTVQESQSYCNQDLWKGLDPKNLTQEQLGQPSDYCKTNATQDSQGFWEPIPECKSVKGLSGSLDPDKDDNICTHNTGYVSRGDVCADGRDNCLISYDLTDPHSTNNRSNGKNEYVAPGATDVSSGLDTYGYLTGGKVQQMNREYIGYYRPQPPRVAAPDISKSSASANSQPIMYMDSINVNGFPEGTVYFGGGQGLATIQFYAWAAHNQGPLRKIVIDWGDGTVQNIDDAQMKNQKSLCGTDKECEFVPGLACSSDSDCPPAAGACVQTGNCKLRTYKTCNKDADCGSDDSCDTRMLFGNSNDSCKQGYLEFKHVYSCDRQTIGELSSASLCDLESHCEKQPDLKCSDCRKDEKCIKGLAPTGGCYNTTLDRCRFTPKVQVYDNWGWCAGDCSQDNEMLAGGPSGSYPIRHPFGGCYDGSSVKINSDIMCSKDHPYSCSLPNECDPNGSQNKSYRPWIVYKGSIEVAPSAKLSESSFTSDGSQINKLPFFQKTKFIITP